MLEMSSSHLQTNTQKTGEGKGEGEVQDVEAGEDGGEEGEVTITLGINPMHATRGGTAATAPESVTEIEMPNAARARWNKLRQTTRASRTFRNGGKQRIKRLSKVMKARQNESGGGDGGGDSMGGEDGEIHVKTKMDVEVDVSIHVDEAIGRRYSYNETTGQTQWLFGDDEENGANN